MNQYRSAGQTVSAALVLGLLLVLGGCSDEGSSPVAPADSEVNGVTMGSQARLWLTVENAESIYVGEDADDWLTDSWVTEAQEFDLVVTNTSGFPVEDLYLLVTIPAEYRDVPGWFLQVGDLVLGPSDFVSDDTSQYGFDGGSHGVFPPSGTGVFYPHPMPGIFPSGESWSTHITVWKGEVDGFRVHFDAGSTRLWSPPSHDVTVLPPAGGIEIPPEACCLPEGRCDLLRPDICVDEMGGVPLGPGTICDPDPCVPPPPDPEGCCMPDGSCRFIVPDECAADGGMPQGVGTDCGTVTCGGGGGE